MLDALALDIEERCYQLLALQQPMAGDLRAIVTAIRMVSEIERSGDLVVNIAKGARRIYGIELRAPPARAASRRWARRRPGSSGSPSTPTSSTTTAWPPPSTTSTTGSTTCTRTTSQEIFETHGRRRASRSRPGVQLALIGRYYERIGDHAVNIGERVRYMVTGWLPEHTGACAPSGERGAATTHGRRPGRSTAPTDATAGREPT